MLSEAQLDAVHDAQDRERQENGNPVREQWRHEARMIREAIRIIEAFGGSLPRLYARQAELRDLLWDDV